MFLFSTLVGEECDKCTCAEEPKQECPDNNGKEESKDNSKDSKDNDNSKDQPTSNAKGSQDNDNSKDQPTSNAKGSQDNDNSKDQTNSNAKGSQDNDNSKGQPTSNAKGSQDNDNSKDQTNSNAKGSQDNDNSKDQSKDNNNSKDQSKDNDNSKSKDNDNSKDKDSDKAKDDSTANEPPKIGMFSLPGSQQPTGLYTLGGTIIDKGEVEIDFFIDYFKGKKKVVSDVLTSILLGASEDLAVSFHFPFTPRFQDGCYQSSGFEDFIIQVEWAFFNRSTKCNSDQATLVWALSAPTGNFNKNPAIGFGAPGLLVAGTYIHTAINWLAFINEGVILTTSNNRIKIGDQFIYQCGFSGRLPSPCGWLFTWMVELDGMYSRKNRVDGLIDDNSGGNVIYFTPSLWFSNKNVKIQFGPSFPITQHVFGVQRKFDYVLAFYIAWSFYDE